MAKVMDDILESFYAMLAESDTIEDAVIKELRALFASQKKLKADDFVAILEEVGNEET